jgi:zinc transporter ZupT
MNLLTETLIISLGMAMVSCIPLYSKTLRKYSGLFYLLGTGALAGILFFDLVPDLYELGGMSAMAYIGVVWFLYSLIHIFQMKHHQHEVSSGAAETLAHDHENELAHSHHGNGSSVFFLLSMIAHCFASGMLLVTSAEFSTGLNRSIFLALLAHKLYESLTVSSVLIEKQKSEKKSMISILIYSASLPAGVGLTYLFRTDLTPPIALLATSLAAGTLLGCLIFDFFLPSLGQIRKSWKAMGWIAIGLISAQFLMKTL